MKNSRNRRVAPPIIYRVRSRNLSGASKCNNIVPLLESMEPNVRLVLSPVAYGCDTHQKGFPDDKIN